MNHNMQLSNIICLNWRWGLLIIEYMKEYADVLKK